MLDAQILDAFRCADPLPADSLLLGGKQRFANPVGVVGRQQLSLLLVELDELHFGLGNFLCGQDTGCFDLRLDCRPDALPLSIAHFQSGVMILNGRLNGRHAVRGLGAVGVLLAAADEVLIDATVAGGFGEDQPPVALSAVDTAAQVVEVPPGAFAADPLGLQQVLNFLEGGRVNQRLMASGVDLAVVADNARVVAVVQYGLPILGLERTGYGSAGWPGAQATVLHDGRQLGERVVAAGIELECLAHQRCPLRVETDRAYLAVIHGDAAVQVADRRPKRRAAVLCLLGSALHDLSRQVAAVELGNGGHDAVEQQARWRLINVLGGGDELCPGLADGHDDLYVVSTVAGQAVHLVDDHVVNVAAFQPVEHGPQGWALGGCARLASVDVLIDNFGL